MTLFPPQYKISGEIILKNKSRSMAFFFSAPGYKTCKMTLWKIKL